MEKELEQNAPTVEEESLQNYRQDSDSSKELEKAAKEFKEKEYKFDAFISYRHVEPDQSIAKQLHQMIESFTPPKEFYKDGKKTSFRVFRDREELAARDLSSSIEEALAESRYLIVLCSKRTPLSEWCEKEIRTFRQLHGDERIIPVLIEGEPDEAFPAPLKQLKRGADQSLADVLAADIRPDEVLRKDFPGYEEVQKKDSGKLQSLTKQALHLLKTEKYRIMATILGCTFGDLKQRDKERKNRLILTISSISGAIFLLFAIFMFNAYQKAEQARQEAVQSNAGILMKSSQDIAKEGDYLKAALVAKEAMKPIREGMKSFKRLNAEKISIFNDAIYHSGASTLTAISTKNKLSFMAISNDEKLLAFGLGNDETAIAKVENGEIIKVLPGHSQQVKFLAFSKDDKLLVSAAFDNSIIVYDVESGEEKAKLEIPGVPMLGRFSGDNAQFFYISFTNTSADFYVFDTNTWQQLSTFSIQETVKFADFKKDGSEVLITLVNNDETHLTRRSLKDGSILSTLDRVERTGLDGSSLSLSYKSAFYSNDGKSMILLTDDEIRKISLEDHQVLFEEKIGTNSTLNRPLVESENGDRLAINSYNKILILNGETGETIDEVFFGDLDLKYFAYNAEQNMVAGFGEAGIYSIWKDKVITDDRLYLGGIAPSELYFLKDGSKILTNSHEGQSIKIIDTKSRISSEPVQGRIIATSNDSTKLLLFDGTDFLISTDNGKSGQKITKENTVNYGLMTSTKQNILSNDGKYYAYVGQMADTGNPGLVLYNVESQEAKTVEIPSAYPALYFSDDGKKIYLQDNKEGLKVYSVEDFSLLDTYPDITDSSINIRLSGDEKILLVNRFSGIASLYNMETKEHLEDIPGEGLYLEHKDGDILLKGIQNNTAFSWSSKSGMQSLEMDEALTQTPVSFDDVNLYNEKENLLLLIRNNETERKAYVVDFATGHLMMSFTPSVKRYHVNGHISPKGDVIMVDQSFNTITTMDNSGVQNYMTTAVYHILSDEEVSAEVDKILAGRSLTREEKIQIGISTE